MKKILRGIIRRFFGATRGFGHPVSAAAFDSEFHSGHWQLLDSSDENSRYATLLSLIRTYGVRKPILLDAGCGSGRLAQSFHPGELSLYHGVDLSNEAIRHARVSALAGAEFQQDDLETWTTSARYDVIVINEVMGYFHDPRATLARLSTFLEPNGILIVSLYRWGNAPAIWKRVSPRFHTVHAGVTANAAGDKVWDIRVLRPRT